MSGTRLMSRTGRSNYIIWVEYAIFVERLVGNLDQIKKNKNKKQEIRNKKQEIKKKLHDF